MLGIVVLEQRRQRRIDQRTGIGKNYNPLERTRRFNFPRMRNRPVKNRSASVKKKKKVPKIAWLFRLNLSLYHFC